MDFCVSPLRKLRAVTIELGSRHESLGMSLLNKNLEREYQCCYGSIVNEGEYETALLSNDLLYEPVTGNTFAISNNFSENNLDSKRAPTVCKDFRNTDRIWCHQSEAKHRYCPPAVYFTNNREPFPVKSSALKAFVSKNKQQHTPFNTQHRSIPSSPSLSKFQDVQKDNTFGNHLSHDTDNDTDKLEDKMQRNNPYRHADFDDIASSGNFETDNDLFVNFNESLEQLPDLQRELGKRLRRHLQFFFMNPLQKYRIRRQFPFKLVLQILKVVFITIQLVLFAELRISHVDFLDNSVTVMRHKFLKDWDNDRDEVVYPPDSGKYSLYTSDQIIEHFGHIVKAYYSVQNDSFASFSYDTTFSQNEGKNAFKLKQQQQNTSKDRFGQDFSRIPPIKLCRDRIADVTIQNDTYIFDISEVNECFSLNFTQKDIEMIFHDKYAIRKLLDDHNISFTAEDALIMSKASIIFNLRTIHFSPLSNDQKPECYLIKVIIEFDNSRHTGQVFVRLNAIISYVNLCNGRVLQVGSVGVDTIIIGIIDVLVLLMCLASFTLCCRALIKAHLLKVTTCDFFENVFKRHLSVKDQLEFFNLWYVMIVINDVFIVLGTIFKITIEFRDFDSDLFTLTGILLGLGALLVYIGLLRYLGFFNQYNILVLTLKRSLPSILRFLVCTIILYMGFLIAGWVIIGPYSIKFRTLSQSSEALFSLLNGDDMFATFYTISDSSTTIKVFGTIYIYVFVCLFIYVVLSLFISIIMDAYEVVKEQYNQGLEVERSMIYEFLASTEPLDESSGEAREIFAADRLLRLDDSWFLHNWSDIRQSLRHIWRHRDNNPDENRSNGGRGTLFDYCSFENPVLDNGSLRSSASARSLDVEANVEAEASHPHGNTFEMATDISTFNNTTDKELPRIQTPISASSPTTTTSIIANRFSQSPRNTEADVSQVSASFSRDPNDTVRLGQLTPPSPSSTPV